MFLWTQKAFSRYIKKTVKKKTFGPFALLGPYLWPYRWHYGAGLVCLILVDGMQILIPQVSRSIIDAVVKGNLPIRQLLLYLGALLLIAAIMSGGRFLWRYFISGSARKIEAQLRQDLYEHLLKLSYDFYQQHKIGDLMARATNDLQAVRQSISMGVVTFIDGTVMALAILTILFIQEPRTSLVAVLPLPLITILIITFGKLVGQRFKKVQELYSRLSEVVQESFAGSRVVKSFVKEGWFLRKFKDVNEEYIQANMGVTTMFGLFFPLVGFLSGITSLIVVLVGGRRVIMGELSVGTLVAVFSYVQMLIWPMLGAGFTINLIQRGAASLERIGEIFHTPPTIVSPSQPGRPLVGKSPVVIRIKNLHFAYPQGEAVLKGIDLDIPRGSLVGILGKTGSGKTTLLKTLCRLVDPPEGTVFLEDLDVRRWDLPQLRSCFGMTPQDAFLFSDSVKNNALYGLESPSREELLPALAIHAGLVRDLEEFTQGWDTVIGERGVSLSGGQKQRVSYARAIVRDPDILLLDDAFSAVDAETEKHILTHLLKTRKGKGKTTIIVSHRISTLQQADLVVVLDKGRIQELGSPRDLARQKGYYATIAQLQRISHG